MNTLFCLMLCVTVDWTATPVRLSDVPEGLSAEATLVDGTGTVVFRNRSGRAVPISFDSGTLKVVTSRLTDATQVQGAYQVRINDGVLEIRNQFGALLIIR